MKFKKLAPLFLAGAMFLSNTSSVLANSISNYVYHDQDLSLSSEWTGLETFIHNNLTYQHAAEITNNNGVLHAGSLSISPVTELMLSSVFIVNEHLQIVDSATTSNASTNTNAILNWSSFENLGPGFYYVFGMTTLVSDVGGFLNFNTSATNWFFYTGSYSIESRPESNSRDLFSINLEEAIETNGMIKALNSDGISGYIYARELVGDVTEEIRLINLYDEDGVTVIGEFQIG